MSESSRINGDIALTSALVRSLLPIREVVTDTLPCSLISKFARAAGAEVCHILNAELCKQYGFDYLKAAITAGLDGVFLSDDEVTIEFSPRVEAGFANLAGHPRLIRAMTPDELLSQRVGISWLALTRLDAKLLEVSSQTITQHRPLISGFIQLDAEIAPLFYGWCEEHGYTAVDSALNPLVIPFSEYCYLMPDANLLSKVKWLLGVSNTLGPLPSNLKMHAQRYWGELVNVNDELASLTAEYLYTQHIEYAHNSLLIIPHSLNESRVFIPLYATGYYDIKFSVLGDEHIPADTVVRCFVNGRLRVSQVVTNDTSVSIPHYESNVDGIVQLLIVADVGMKTSALDDGITCSKFRICWQGDPDE